MEVTVQEASICMVLTHVYIANDRDLIADFVSVIKVLFIVTI